VLNGTIQNQPISDEVQIKDVESKQKISFPEANIGGGGSSTNSATNTNLLDSQISNILNQITNDINNIRDDIGTLAESNSNIQEGIQNTKNIAERSYMVSVTAIGVGAVGILIAAAALVRTR
jgi:3-deoxy-D-arabino-heptulosonate 7-phosphate (DAHP) synthase